MTISPEALQSPEFKEALETSISALRHLADFHLDPAICARMQKLGEDKEFLTEEEHKELLSFISFSERRNLEKLEAKVALNRLGNFIPELSK